LKPGSVTLDGKDSQPISALLIAANFIEGVTEVTVTDPGEKPWVEMTLSWFDRLNIPYLSEDYTHYRIQGKSPYTGFHYTVKGDWSSAAFPLAAALVTRSTLKLNGLDLEEPQGDKQLIPILEAMGAKITWDNDQLVVHATETLKGTTIDVNDLIDALPILAVIGCFAEGETRLVNGAVAATKESNRLEVIASELRKMGAAIEEIDDGLLIHHSPLVGAEVDSHKDHRIAMALTVAALGAKGATRIKDIECVRKTFPNFCPSLQKVGALMERQ
ncbi:MAG: 3-phosphoshikimate 1-carboxyvinyltransferase, partial [Chlamydiia bacterium]|nr:3-phosphoshikimate 1-carboxyvinyltransferase [Chlamydiia bacterium]